jgi:hypothetical protein
VLSVEFKKRKDGKEEEERYRKWKLINSDRSCTLPPRCPGREWEREAF